MRIAVEIVEPVVLHTSQAQPQSREKVSSGVVSLPAEHAATRRDTYETWGHHAFSRARKPETNAQTASTTARWHPGGWGVDVLTTFLSAAGAHTPEAQARAVRGVVLPVHIKLDLCTKQNIICEELFDLFSAWTAHYVGEISCDPRHPSLQDSPKTAPRQPPRQPPRKPPRQPSSSTSPVVR